MISTATTLFDENTFYPLPRTGPASNTTTTATILPESEEPGYDLTSRKLPEAQNIPSHVVWRVEEHTALRTLLEGLSIASVKKHPPFLRVVSQQLSRVIYTLRHETTSDFLEIAEILQNLRERTTSDFPEILQDLKEKTARENTIERIINLRDIEDGWADEDSVAPSEQAISDALRFVALLPDDIPAPFVAPADDGQIVLDWLYDTKKAVIGIDGDHYFGYTLFIDGKFRPGAEEGSLLKEGLPKDLMDYLRS